MKFTALALASAVQLVVGDSPQCNPAIQCPSMSIECMSCNVRLESNCDPKDPAIGQGLCVEPAALDFDGLVYGMNLEERCRRIVDHHWKTAPKEPSPYDYIHSCRTGQYTCNDGYCENALNFPEECYKGVYNSNRVQDDNCNIHKGGPIMSKLRSFIEGLEHDKYCTKHGGVRFGPIRCDHLSILDSDFEPDCPAGTEPKPPTCGDSDDTITLFGPSDACTATCNDYKELFNYPGCCVGENEPQVCSSFVVYRPEEDVGRCSESVLESGCDSCLDTVKDGLPYCCTSPTEPVCVDAEGRNIEGKKTKCADDSGPFPTLKGNVCYVDSSGSFNPTPPVSDTGFGASGVELTFDFQEPDDLEPESDCCCDIVCSCFGDPHCTSFFGDYEVSQAEEGSYLMVSEGKFELTGDLAEPLGITETYHAVVGDYKVKIDAAKCAYGEGIYVDGKLVDDTSDIEGVEYKRTTSRPNKNDSRPWAYNKPLQHHLALHPAFVILSNGPYVAEIKCLRFKMTRGPSKGWWTRLDATVRRAVDEVTGEPGCCPNKETVFDELVDGNDDLKGFCFRHPGASGFYLPEGQDLTGLGDRRLSVAEQVTLNLPRDLSNMNVVANAYAAAAGVSLTTAILEVQDRGARAIKELTDIINDNCKYYASDEAFVYTESAHCEGGLILEAKKPTQSEWTPIRFFPKNVNYCDNKVLVLYEHTKVNGALLDSTYELRLSGCTPDKDICGDVASNPCQPYGGVEDLGVSKFTYGSTLTDALKDLLERSSEECSCTADPVKCVMNCITTGDCPQVGSCP